MPVSTVAVGMRMLPLCARIAAACLNYALLVLLSRGAPGDRTSSELRVCLMQLPLLQQLVSFIAREGTARAAARCTSAKNDQLPGDTHQQQQSSFNLSYLSFSACCCVSLLAIPVWLYLFPPEHAHSNSGQRGAAHAYSLAAAAFAAAGLVDAAAEILSLRCLLLQSPNSRSIAEAVSAATRAMLLGASVLMQQRTGAAAVTATRSLLMNPMVAFGGSHLCASLIFLQVLWLQCHWLVTRKAASPRPPRGAEATSEASLERTRRLLVAWPAFQRLSTNSFSSTGVTYGSCTKAVGGSPALATSTASVAAALGTKRPAGAAIQLALRRYLSAEHLELLPTYLMLLAQKMLLQHGEQLLLLLLLDGRAAAEYAVTSGAASVICRVVFSQLEAAAFEGFCVLQRQPAAVFATAATNVAQSGAPVDTGRLPEERTSGAVTRKKKCESVKAKRCAGQHLLLRRNALDCEPSKPNQRLHCELQRHQSLLTEHCASRDSDTYRDMEGHKCSRRGVRGPLGSWPMVKLICLLGCPKHLANGVLIPSHSPALALLQLMLLLQGTLGLAAVAGGCLFGAPLLRCFFGPSTVAPESGFVKTLQVYCCYVCCLAFFGHLDAYASASCSSGSLRLLERCYLAVTAMHLVLLLPLSVRFSAVSYGFPGASCLRASGQKLLQQHLCGRAMVMRFSSRKWVLIQAFGIPAGAGAAAAQVVAAVLRIGCCCLSISNDLRERSNQRPLPKLDALGHPAAAQHLTPEGCSDCISKTRGGNSRITTTSSALRNPACKAGVTLASGETAGLWDSKMLPAIWAVLPPGSTALALRYLCCFLAAAAARSVLRHSSFVYGEGTAAAAGYDMHQVMLGGYTVPLWVAEMSLAVVVCAASVAAAGPLLVREARDAYYSAAAAASISDDYRTVLPSK